jgi:hypothetical protein
VTNPHLWTGGVRSAAGGAAGVLDPLRRPGGLDGPVPAVNAGRVLDPPTAPDLQAGPLPQRGPGVGVRAQSEGWLQVSSHS